MEQPVEILLIEDNPDEAQLTIRSLKGHNLANRLMHIDDGEEALEFIFSTGKYADNKLPFNPKLILLDLKLPKIDGLEILKRLKADERTKLLPVAVLTSSKEEKDMVASYKLGVNAYVVKPVDFHEFVNAIRELGVFWAVINEPPPGSMKK